MTAEQAAEIDVEEEEHADGRCRRAAESEHHLGHRVVALSLALQLGLQVVDLFSLFGQNVLDRVDQLGDLGPGRAYDRRSLDIREGGLIELTHAAILVVDDPLDQPADQEPDHEHRQSQESDGAQARAYPTDEPSDQESDNQYVISNAGDEMSVQFNAESLPKLPKGWRRDFLIHSVGWVKDGDMNTAEGNRVEPLPFHGMKSYPPSPDDIYPATPEILEYHKRYNTRVIKSESGRENRIQLNVKPGE